MTSTFANRVLPIVALLFGWSEEVTKPTRVPRSRPVRRRTVIESEDQLRNADPLNWAGFGGAAQQAVVVRAPLGRSRWSECLGRRGRVRQAEAPTAG